MCRSRGRRPMPRARRPPCLLRRTGPHGSSPSTWCVAHAPQCDRRQVLTCSLLTPAPPLLLLLLLLLRQVTRWYRAPELILMQNEYSSAIDVRDAVARAAAHPIGAADRAWNCVQMWSVGCIFGELLQTVEPGIARPQPLFPGEGCYPLSDRVDRATMDNDEIGEEELEELSNETHQLHRIFQARSSRTLPRAATALTFDAPAGVGHAHGG